MSSIEQALTQRAAEAFDAHEEFYENLDPQSIEHLQQAFPLSMASIVSEWAASFHIKTRHDLMKSSINAIR